MKLSFFFLSHNSNPDSLVFDGDVLKLNLNALLKQAKTFFDLLSGGYDAVCLGKKDENCSIFATTCVSTFNFDFFFSGASAKTFGRTTSYHKT